MLCACGCGQEAAKAKRTSRTVKRGDWLKYVRGHDKRLPRGPITFGEIEGGKVAYIPLTQGKVAIVDVEDEPLVSRHLWCYSKRGYAVRNVNQGDGGRTLVSLHRFLMEVSEGAEVDHKNGNRLDCRKRCNLRLATTQQNTRNQTPQKGRSSRFKGVSLHRLSGKWHSYITISAKKIHIGVFDEEERAARAYNERAREWFGEFARLNEV